MAAFRRRHADFLIASHAREPISSPSLPPPSKHANTARRENTVEKGNLRGPIRGLIRLDSPARSTVERKRVSQAGRRWVDWKTRRAEGENVATRD
jgi:hypothetical protein